MKIILQRNTNALWRLTHVVLLVSAFTFYASPTYAAGNWSIDSSFGNQSSLDRNANATTYWASRTGGARIVLAEADGTLEVLNEDGSVEATFGQNGKVAFSSPGYVLDSFSAVAADGVNLVAAGTSYRSGYGQSDGFLVRYRSSGILDNSFGQNGIVRLHVGTLTDISNVLIAPNRSLFVAGTSYTASYAATPFVAKFSSTGQLDNGFGTQGILVLDKNLIPVVEQNGVSLERANLDSQGRVVIVGGHRAGIQAFATWFVARITTSGQLDSTFANAGIRYLTPLTGEDYLGRDIAIDPEDNIFLSGYFCDWVGSTATTYAGFMSFDNAGNLRSTFGRGGILKDAGHPGSVAWRILRQPSGSLLSIGTDNTSKNVFLYNFGQSVDSLSPDVLSPLGSKLFFLSMVKTAGNSILVSANGSVQRIIGPLDPSVTVAGAPVITSVLNENNQIRVNFMAPTDNGGADVSNYEFSMDAGSTWSAASPAQTSSPLVISGLTSGITYAVKVRAVNSVGTGAESNAVSVTPQTTASAPTISSITAGDHQATANFTSPSDSGGSVITNYEYSTDGGSTWTAASPEQTSGPLVISGLTNGTNYSVKLRAVNSVGSGSESNAVSVKPVAPASAPTISGVVAGNGQATLSITAPSQVNDSSLLGYDYSTNNGSTWSHFASVTGPFTITGLTNATAYQVKVRAVNSAGAGEASGAVTVNPTRLVPAKPVIASVVGGNASATVNITTPTDVTAQSITGYQYSIDKGATYQNAPVSNGTFTINGLTNGVSTSVQIRATNFNGNSLASVAKTVVPATTPAAPSITTITPSTGALSIAFTAPNTGGSAITSYQYSLDGGSTWVVPAKAIKTSPIKVTGLPNATSYQVKIRAVNAQGIGAASDAVSASTPVLVPSAPVTTSIAKSSTSLTVDVTAPANNGGGAITNYAYSVDNGKTWTPVSPASNSTRIVITGLTPNTIYPVQIAAINSAGRGAASAKYNAGTLR